MVEEGGVGEVGGSEGEENHVDCTRMKPAEAINYTTKSAHTVPGVYSKYSPLSTATESVGASGVSASASLARTASAGAPGAVQTQSSLSASVEPEVKTQTATAAA